MERAWGDELFFQSTIGRIIRLKFNACNALNFNSPLMIAGNLRATTKDEEKQETRRFPGNH